MAFNEIYRTVLSECRVPNLFTVYVYVHVTMHLQLLLLQNFISFICFNLLPICMV